MTDKQMTRITEAGEYEVRICAPHFELLEAKNGDASRMALVLPGETADDQYIDARLFFTRQIIASGRNAGRPTYEVSAELCHMFGLPRPFNPANIENLDGKAAIFVVEIEDYQGKPRATVKFVNTPRKEALSEAKANSIWNDLTKGSAGAGMTSEAPDENDDNLPF